MSIDRWFGGAKVFAYLFTFICVSVVNFMTKNLAKAANKISQFVLQFRSRFSSRFASRSVGKYGQTAAILLFVVACFAVSILMMLTKIYVAKYHASPSQLLTWRYIAVFVFVLPVMIKRKFAFLNPKLLAPNAARDAIYVAANFIWYTFGANVPINDSTAISFLTPVAAVILSSFIFGEKITAMLCVSICVCFVGVFVVVQPAFSQFAVSYAMIIFGAILRSLVPILSKKVLTNQSPTDASLCWSFLMLVIGCIISPPQLLLLTPTFAASIAVMALVSLIYIFAINAAISLANVGSLQPFDFSRIVFSAILGYAILNEATSLHVITGVAIIIVGNILAASASASVSASASASSSNLQECKNTK